MSLRNVGTVDRAARIAVGLVALALVFVGPRTLWGLVGLVPLVTALAGWCPAYALLGVRTCAAPPDAGGAPGAPQAG